MCVCGGGGPWTGPLGHHQVGGGRGVRVCVGGLWTVPLGHHQVGGVVGCVCVGGLWTVRLGHHVKGVFERGGDRGVGAL